MCVCALALCACQYTLDNNPAAHHAPAGRRSRGWRRPRLKSPRILTYATGCVSRMARVPLLLRENLRSAQGRVQQQDAFTRRRPQVRAVAVFTSNPMCGVLQPANVITDNLHARAEEEEKEPAVRPLGPLAIKRQKAPSHGQRTLRRQRRMRPRCSGQPRRSHRAERRG